jgi:hypothetical protein
VRKSISNSLLSLFFLIPYVVSYVLLFYQYSVRIKATQSQLKRIQALLDLSDLKFNLGVIIFVVFGSILILLFIFIILKFFLLFGDKSVDTDKDLFRSLVLSMTITNVAVLFLNEYISLNFKAISLISPFFDLIIFLLLYYSSTKNIKNTVLLFTGKGILYLSNVFYLIYVNIR